jgi:hypothetical protein
MTRSERRNGRRRKRVIATITTIRKKRKRRRQRRRKVRSFAFGCLVVWLLVCLFLFALCYCSFQPYLSSHTSEEELKHTRVGDGYQCDLSSVANRCVHDASQEEGDDEAVISDDALERACEDRNIGTAIWNPTKIDLAERMEVELDYRIIIILCLTL